MRRPKTLKFEKPQKGIISAPQSTEDGLERCFSFNAEQDTIRMMEVFITAARHGNAPAQKYAAKLIEFRKLQGRKPSAAQPDTTALYYAAIQGDERAIGREYRKLVKEWKDAAIPLDDKLYYPEGVHSAVVRDTSKVLKAMHNRWFMDDQKIEQMQDLARKGGCIEITDAVLRNPAYQDLFEGENLRAEIEKRAGKKMHDEYRAPCFSFATDNVLTFIRPKP